METAKITLDDSIEEYLEVVTTLDCLEVLLGLWLSGRSPRPPTWRSLLQVLTELGLQELSQQIEDYFQDGFKLLL